jgi:predicted ATPase
VQVKKLVGEHRLLTLLGLGGIGKSRLSLQAGADLIDDFPDGVWLVELAHLSDPHLVPQAVASVLGVKEAAGRPVLEALVKFVKDRRLLVIVDNCEHLLAACAELVRDLLKASPHCRILTSSREPLRVAGEATFPMPSLPASDAERLFVERARTAKPDFTLHGDAAAIASVCRRLDGIPLAIELAAARVRTHSPEAIATRLDDRFRLLTRGDRGALPRQQTLRALIDWSHDLLAERERAVFRRLAVFAGGWTIDAAEEVAAFAEIHRTDVLDIVSDLAEKSLVVVDAEGERYGYLETVRAYAYEKLTDARELAEARLRHLKHFMAFAEKARPELMGPRQGEWLTRLDVERENLLAAHAWCDRAPSGAELGVRLAYLVKPYWLNRGLLGLGLRFTTDALARPGAPKQARLNSLHAAGQFSMAMGDYVAAQRYLEECRTGAQETADQRVLCVALQPLGLVYMSQGDLSQARRVLEESCTLARNRGEQREIAASVNALGQVARMEGRLAEAEALYEEMLALMRAVDDRESIAVALLNLAIVAIERAHHERARELLLGVVALVDETGSRLAGQYLMDLCVGLAALRKEWKTAARLYGAAEAEASRTGLRRDAADATFLDPRVAEVRKQLGADFDAEAKAGRATSYDEGVSLTRGLLR